MKKDRNEICKIISDMLREPDENMIYPTSTAYTRLEHYIEQQRTEAIGCTHAACCIVLDQGGDPRTEEVPRMLGTVYEALNK